MKLLIVGSRGITDFDFSPYIPTEVDTMYAKKSNKPFTLVRL